jgi:8-oxo-dGTP pyrophosphatase MutT (NUDIX family)
MATEINRVEYFDVYTINRIPLGKKYPRGSQLSNNEYRLVVMGILINDSGEVLLTKRSKNKIAGGKWECTAGLVQAGENSKAAIIREI